MKTGKFISIEGQDGAGKTTNIEFICSELADKNIEHITTREPGGTALGESIRDILLVRSELNITPMSELLLMFAARAQHLASIIEPALSQGIWVVCDRFTDASFAYQGGGHGIESSIIQDIADMIQQGRQPDLTFLLDVDTITGESRVNSRNEKKDRFEMKKIDFKQRVREAYLQLERDQPERVKLINASQSIDSVKQQITNELTAFIRLPG